MQWEVVRAGSRGHGKALPAAVGHFVNWDCGPSYTHALVSSLQNGEVGVLLDRQ